MNHRTLTPQNYYRLPWNLSDNAITWLEPTTKCNIYCEGCYRENNPEGHRPIESVIEELEALKKLRKTDGISIAGGEPLIYPDIVELVRYVASQGWKPIVNTNGQALNPELVVELKNAGLVGFTFHVDSHQKRPEWAGKNELELNDFRLKLAEMTHEASEGKVACAFNATIYRDTIEYIPALTKWAQDNMKIVHTMVYILYRSVIWDKDDWDVYVKGEKIEPQDLFKTLVYKYDFKEGPRETIMAQDIADKIRKIYPDYEPCAYLNGTEDPLSMKWLMSLRIGNKNRILGHVDNKFMELIQGLHHFIFGTYLAYSKPSHMKISPAIFFLALFNRSIRKIFFNWLRNPANWLKRQYSQGIMIIQPVDLFEDGRQNMCDGCPDAILHNGKLVWSCRVDEIEKMGGFLTGVPRK
ncbi:radical SAM protein [Thermodesulfobacteriota bacterium]